MSDNIKGEVSEKWMPFATVENDEQFTINVTSLGMDYYGRDWDPDYDWRVIRDDHARLEADPYLRLDGPPQRISVLCKTRDVFGVSASLDGIHLISVQQEDPDHVERLHERTKVIAREGPTGEWLQFASAKI